MAPRDIDLELHRAIEATDVDAVRQLLSRKADPNCPSDNGLTPLELAVRRSSLPICRLLLVYQAEIRDWTAERAPRSEASTLVHNWANINVAVVFATLDELVVDATGKHDLALLSLALACMDIMGGDAERVAALRDPNKNTLLHICAMGERVDHGPRGNAAARLTARMLLGWGVPVDSHNDAGETALQVAMREMHSTSKGQLAGGACVPTEPARALLEAAADVEMVDPQTELSLLMLATKEGDLAACQLLLKFGADPLRRNPQGQTAISLSANRPEMTSLLKSSLIKMNGEMEMPGVGAVCVAGEAALQMNNLQPDMNGTESTSTGEAVAVRPAELVQMAAEEETCSAEGILNQVDLEDIYVDLDWTGHLNGDWNLSTNSGR